MRLSIKMTSFMSIVPTDIAILIANQLDIKSFSQFLATCTYVNNNTKSTFNNKVNDNIENLFKHILITISDFNTSLLETDNKHQATQDICKSVFKNILEAKSATDMDYLFTLLENPVSIIAELIDGTEQDVHIVLDQFISEETLEQEFQKQVLKAIQDCLFTKEYNVVFELFDNKNQDIKYRFRININVSGSIPELKVVMVDEELDIDLCDNAFSDNINDYIENAEITCDGEIVLTATEEGIKGLTKYICKVFGNGVFTHKLTDAGVKIEICNFLNQPFECCEVFREVVNDMSITQQASSNITKLIT